METQLCSKVTFINLLVLLYKNLLLYKIVDFPTSMFILTTCVIYVYTLVYSFPASPIHTYYTMAERYFISSQEVDPIEDRINHTIDYVIGLLNSRRARLLESLHIAREEERVEEKTRLKNFTQLADESEETKMGNEVPKIRKKIPSHIQFKWSHNLVRSISRFGNVVNTPSDLPDYANLTSVIATGKFGHGSGNLHGPRGIAIHETTHQIYVTDCSNNKVEIFSDTGEHIYTLSTNKLQGPHGVAIHKDNLYLIGYWESTVSKFSLNDMSFIKKVGGLGRNNGQFRNPNQLTTDHVGNVYVADRENHRICVYDSELNHLYNTNPSISQPLDVKISNDHMYVLSRSDNPCMHVLTLEGKKLYSIISRGKGLQLLEPHFFCFDSLHNFVISDELSHFIRVFSPGGDLLHTIGGKGHLRGMFNNPYGVAITPNGRLVSVSQNTMCGLQIFSSLCDIVY